MSEKRKKILLIQYFYRPFTSNQSYRYERIFESLHDGYQVDILTSHHLTLPETDIIGEINVYRTNVNLLRRDFGKTSSINITNPGKGGILQRIYRNLWWPDFAFLWYFPALSLGKKLCRKENYDIIISGSFPFTCHLVGYSLKRRYSNSYWIVDYIDPFAIIGRNENPSNNVRLYRLLNIWAERRINKRADRILIYEEARDGFSKLFKRSMKNTRVVPPMLGIDKHYYDNAEPNIIRPGTVNIIYLGQMNTRIRNPEGFLELFSDLLTYRPDLTLSFIGNLTDCETMISNYQKSCGDKLQIIGKVSRLEAVKYLKGADILLNFSNDSRFQLPGKIVEYVYSAKKIINYSRKPGTNSEKFLRTYDENEIKYVTIGSYRTREENLNTLMNLIKNQEDLNSDLSKHFPANIKNHYLI